MMSITGKQFNYIHSPGILDSHILELPYIGKTFSLVVMLPRERQGLTRLRLNFNAKHVMKLLKKIALKNVDVYLPKFKLTETYSLKTLLQEKASLKVFNTGANYNRMTDQKNLVLNEVLHKVVIEVNEKGTEATAATNVGLVSRSQDQEGIIQFKADHPFLYFIWDRRTGMMLFLGQITHFNTKHKNKNENQEDLMENMKKGRYVFKMQ